MGIYTPYSVPSMSIYIVFFSSLETIAIAAWKLFEQVIPIFYILNNTWIFLKQVLEK